MDYDESMERFHRTLEIAMKNDALLMVMDTLIKMAELFVETGEKERAIEILTLILHYPLRVGSKARAEALYLELEAELGPRVIADAQTLANELTLDDLLAALLSQDKG